MEEEGEEVERGEIWEVEALSPGSPDQALSTPARRTMRRMGQS